MIVRGDSTIIDYHAPFDQGFTRHSAHFDRARALKNRYPPDKSLHPGLGLLPPQGFGPEAKTRGGTLEAPAWIHIRNFKNVEV